MIIRRFQNEDANELADVIAYTLRTTNIKDYSPEYIENDISFLRAENLIERSKWMNIPKTLAMSNQKCYTING